jgi:hypothetical protein
MDYERLLESALREFETTVEAIVEREFAAAAEAMRHGKAGEIPIIGGAWPPPQYRGVLKQRAMRALKARKWFEFEAPLWCQPLPLSQDECVALLNQPNRRLFPVANYGTMLRSHGWDLTYVLPFEVFVADELNPPAVDDFSTRQHRRRTR